MYIDSTYRQTGRQTDRDSYIHTVGTSAAQKSTKGSTERARKSVLPLGCYTDPFKESRSFLCLDGIYFPTNPLNKALGIRL